MNSHRWINRNHPQTLQSAVFLLYLNAVFVLFGGGLTNLLGLLVTIGSCAGAFGIANNKRLGWIGAIAITAIQLLLMAPFLLKTGFGTFLHVNFVMMLLAQIAQLALLLHPHSRDYGKIFFER